MSEGYYDSTETIAQIMDGKLDDHSAAPRLKQLAEAITTGRKQLPALLASLPYHRHAGIQATHYRRVSQCFSEIVAILRGDVWTEEEQDDL